MPPYPPPDQNPNCICPNPMAQMFCPYGHMTECHYPHTCNEAECSHYEAALEADSETEAETLDHIWPEDFPNPNSD